LHQINDFEAEAAVLSSDPGRGLLAEVAGVARAGPSDVARWRKAFEPEWVAAALRLVEGRRKGAAKFDRADRMWLDPVGSEQATAEVVARHKARRFGGGGVVVDLCSGIGGDSLALAASSDVIAVDPDRRASGRGRAREVRDYAPGLGALLALAGSSRGGAIKLGPASDFGAHFAGSGFEVELVSLAGECKEATAWFGDLAGPGVRRRATCLPVGATWTDRDGPTSPGAGAGPLGAFVFDPDPSLARAGLLDGFAAAHGLFRFAPGVDLLTGPGRVTSPFLATFGVVEVFPLDLKVLRREVAARGLGPLEIKTRGLEIRPEAYRAALRPAGPNPATWLLVAGRGEPGRAILARREVRD